MNRTFSSGEFPIGSIDSLREGHAGRVSFTQIFGLVGKLPKLCLGHH
jgi:hypothetical protein